MGNADGGGQRESPNPSKMTTDTHFRGYGRQLLGNKSGDDQRRLETPTNELSRFRGWVLGNGCGCGQKPVETASADFQGGVIPGQRWWWPE